MRNVVLITSIIKTPATPLSYIAIRSVFTSKQRFEQTKFTIKTIKEKIPDAEIIIVECSDLTEEELTYFLQNSTYFINLYNNIDCRNNIYSISKSLGEGTMTVYAIRYLIQNNIIFDNFIKISGRYYLSEKFDYNIFNNDKIVIKYYEGSTNSVFTMLYKLPYRYILHFNNFLINNANLMFQCIQYEDLFASFIKETENDITMINNHETIGVAGYISVANDAFYTG